MARKRKPENAWMPPRVYRGKSAYEFHPVTGGAVRLCDLSSAQSDVWSAYEQAVISQHDVKKETFSDLATMFMRSPDFLDLAAETQKDYAKYSRHVCAVFGEMRTEDMEPQHIRIYMDKRGVKSRVQANREKAFISRVFRWGFERGFVKQNPCTGVRQFKEVARTRYISNDEYMAVYNHSPAHVQIAMEIAYLCCARQSDVLALQLWQVQDDGLYIKQGKTGVAQIKIWTDRLRAAVDAALALPLKPGAPHSYLIHQLNGMGYTRDGFNSGWKLAREKAKAAHQEMTFDFTFHDLKAKGISDLDGDLRFKQSVSGHANASQTRRYDRKAARVAVVGGEKVIQKSE